MGALMYNKIIKIIIISLYTLYEETTIDILTDNEIKEKEERAIQLYQNNALFHAKVEVIVNQIMNVINH